MYHGIDEYDGEWITSLALTKDGKSVRLRFPPCVSRLTLH